MQRLILLFAALALAATACGSSSSAAEVASLNDVVTTEAVAATRPRSILELRGLGKSIWSEVDAGRHVAEERDSWG